MKGMNVGSGGGIAILIVLTVFGIAGLICYLRSNIKENPINIENSKEKKKAKKTEEVKRNRNVLIVGRTGSGKSTLANVLLGEEKFSEVSGWNSGTKEIKSEVFEWKGNHYRVIDTIGMGDTSGLSNNQIVHNIRGILKDFRKDGIKRIFYVIGGRFTEEEVKALELFQKHFLNETPYFTIVCSKFQEFENGEKCDANKEKLILENKRIAKLIEKCKVIHVDNPPLCYLGNKTIRESSRKKLLDDLDDTLEIDPVENLDAEKILEKIMR